MTKFIAVASGKGGVGKTTTALNIAKGLTDLGIKTVIVDGNLMTPHVAVQLGIMNPRVTVNDFLKRKRSLSSVIHKHHSGVDMILASPSYNEGKIVQTKQIHKIFRHLDNQYDVVVIDCPAGLGYEISTILKYTDETLVVAQPHLASVIDALKVSELARGENNLVTGLVLNMTQRGRHELSQREVEEMVGLPVIANIPNDKKIKKALHKREVSSHIYPKAKSSKKFRELSTLITGKRF